MESVCSTVSTCCLNQFLLMRGLSRKLYYCVVEPEESKMIYFTFDAIIFHAKFHSLFIALINTLLIGLRVKVKTVYWVGCQY